MFFTFESIYLNIVNLKETNEILQLYGAEIGTLRKIDQEHLESFEIVLKWVSIEGWRRSVEPIIEKMKYYVELRMKGPS